MIRYFVLRTEQYVEPTPNTIAQVARIYYLSWDEIAAFDTSGKFIWDCEWTLA